MSRKRCLAGTTVAVLIFTATSALPLVAQDRLPSMPGFDQFSRMSQQIAGSWRSGALGGNQLRWAEDGTSLEYTVDGKRMRVDLRTRQTSDVTGQPESAPAGGGGGGGGGRGGRGGGAPERGRQFVSAESPTGSRVAFYRDRNLWISDPSGGNESAITTDGSEELRIKYGTASWVYGEELDQTTAMWWSPDGTKLAFYRFDESKVPDYYLQLNQTDLQSSVDIEAYPKAGVDNPIVDIMVYDVATRRSTKLDIRNGQPFTDGVVGHYVYRVRWSPDGRELLMNRTNRRQNIMEFVACSPTTGSCRVVIKEEWPTGWVENAPMLRFLADSSRFIWESERSGFANYYLYDLTGKLHATLTSHEFEVAGIVSLDEDRGQLWYMARDGDNHMKTQLHRVALDGSGHVRLTDPAFNHNVSLSPDGRFFVDVAQTHAQPPTTTLRDASGAEVAKLSSSDLTRFNELGLHKKELFTFTAADGRTTLHGLIHFPSNFDPSRKYPVLMPVYGGPASGSNTASEVFSPSSSLTEYGFIVVNLNTRAAPGMGKRVLDALYMKLGTTEIDDMAAGIRALGQRPYIDPQRVGIYGTSYGGYSSAMAILRYPDVFQAASAASAVTDWRHYDTIYTERYMWKPQENTAGYDAGSAMTYAQNLKGRLMIYYGTADNNVHPNNSMQLIRALQRAGKSFEVQVGPDAGHSALNSSRMLEFFIENLVVRAPGSM